MLTPPECCSDGVGNIYDIQLMLNMRGKTFIRRHDVFSLSKKTGHKIMYNLLVRMSTPILGDILHEMINSFSKGRVGIRNNYH